jgi:hypothetical protein
MFHPKFSGSVAAGADVEQRSADCDCNSLRPAIADGVDLSQVEVADYCKVVAPIDERDHR